MTVNHSLQYYSTAIKNAEENLLSNNPAILKEDHKTVLKLETDLAADIISQSNSLREMMTHLSKLEYDNKLLESNIRRLEDKREGAAGMYDDSHYLYKSKLLENSILFISICALIYNIYQYQYQYQPSVK